MKLNEIKPENKKDKKEIKKESSVIEKKIKELERKINKLLALYQEEEMSGIKQIGENISALHKEKSSMEEYLREI